MKAIARYIFIVLGLVVLWLSTSRTAMQYLFVQRDIKNRWWGIDELDHGDLASLAYLYHIQQFATPVWKDPERPVYNGVKHTDLYIFGDSYTRYIKDTLLFAGLSRYHFIDRIHGGEYLLDTTKRNILIIEVSERYFIDYYIGLNIFNDLRPAGDPKQASLLKEVATSPRMASFPLSFSVDSLFNQYINQNIQFNLFNYQFMMPLFGYKAAINYYLFHRASGDVVIAKDKKNLFLKETVSLTGNSSSYAPVQETNIRILISNCNTIYDHYKAQGFNEVFLSVIPNSATINQPEEYNNLIPAIQNSPDLKIKLIDTYTPFKAAKEPVYLAGDTHWNANGLKIWLNLVNGKLVNE